MSTQHEPIAAGSSKSAAARISKRRRKWAGALVVLAGAGGTYYWLQSGETVPEDEPLIVAVEIGDIENTIASAGALEPSRIVDIGAQVSGQLERLHVDVGDLVERGQLLAEIDARVQQNRVNASRASIEAQRAQIAAREAALELARANAARQARLMAEDATSQQDYDSAVNNLASAESGLRQLERQIEQSVASLASDETQLEFTKIYAPTEGTVVSVEMNEGVTLNASQQVPTILQIATLSTMTVETQISEADVANLEDGMEVYFTTLGGGDRRWYGALDQILPSPVIENNVVLYTGLFDIDNADGALRTGMTAQVYFVTSAARDVLTVPVGALTFPDAPNRAGMAARMAERPASGGSFPDGGNRPAQGSSPGGSFPGGDFPEFPAGDFPGADFPSGGFAGRLGDGGQGGPSTRPRPAIVEVVQDDGSIVEREIVIGVTSRIAAEVISGLSVGDRVVAGIVQRAVANESDDDNGRGFRGPPGGFRRF